MNWTRRYSERFPGSAYSAAGRHLIPAARPEAIPDDAGTHEPASQAGNRPHHRVSGSGSGSSGRGLPPGRPDRVRVPAFGTRISGDYGTYKFVGSILLHGRDIQQGHVPQVWQKYPKNLKYPMVRHLPDAAPRHQPLASEATVPGSVYLVESRLTILFKVAFPRRPVLGAVVN